MIAGTTAQQAADTILYLANAWNNVLGPSIECARLKGKRLVTAAVDASGVASELVTAITALNSL